MDGKFKLGATLSYDKEREQDMIRQLENLTSKHKLGDFISNILRVTFEHPEEMRKLGVTIENYGLSDERKAFYKEVETQVREMSKKIDCIFDMAVKMYSLAQFNKKIGLEDKAKNLLQAQFILQRQVAEICSNLGISTLNQTFESNKTYNVTKDVDATLEFIINYYDGIVNEIRENLVVVQPSNVTANSSVPVVNNEKVMNLEENAKAVETVKSVESTSVSVAPIIDLGADEDDEVIDFGATADLDALNSFFE